MWEYSRGFQIKKEPREALSFFEIGLLLAVLVGVMAFDGFLTIDQAADKRLDLEHADNVGSGRDRFVDAFDDALRLAEIVVDARAVDDGDRNDGRPGFKRALIGRSDELKRVIDVVVLPTAAVADILRFADDKDIADFEAKVKPFFGARLLEVRSPGFHAVDFLKKVTSGEIVSDEDGVFGVLEFFRRPNLADAFDFEKFDEVLEAGAPKAVLLDRLSELSHEFLAEGFLTIPAHDLHLLHEVAIGGARSVIVPEVLKTEQIADRERPMFDVVLVKLRELRQDDGAADPAGIAKLFEKRDALIEELVVDVSFLEALMSAVNVA